MDGGFGDSAASLTFHDPDEILGVDTQADEFRFNFTLPSQDNFNSLDDVDQQLQDNIKMVDRLTILEDETAEVEAEANHFGMASSSHRGMNFPRISK